MKEKILQFLQILIDGGTAIDHELHGGIEYLQNLYDRIAAGGSLFGTDKEDPVLAGLMGMVAEDEDEAAGS